MSRDPSCYRPGVGLVLTNARGLVWLGRRVSGRTGWQLPQGGIEPDEQPEDAAWRELEEEVGTRHAQLLASTNTWTFYDFPPQSKHLPGWIGQRHRWFLFRYLGDDAELNPAVVPDPEFDAWRWATRDEAASVVVSFKQPVYREMFAQLDARFPV